MASIRKRAERIIRGKINKVLSRDEGFTQDEELTPDQQTGPDVRKIECLKILELGLDVSEEEITRAYRKLCKEYHPDRFDSDPEKRETANRLLSEINAAYAYLSSLPK